MPIDLADTSFWDTQSDYARDAHDFTGQYGRAAWVMADVPDEARVLDIAAGTGALALVAAQAGARVLATDFAPGMVAAMLSHALPNLESRVMDGQALDLPDGSFDAAFSMFGITLFPDWQAGLRELARVVRPGGIGCLGTWHEAGGAAGNLLSARLCAALFPEVEAAITVPGMEAMRHPDRLRAALTGVGFVDVRMAVVTYDFIVDAAVLAEPDRLFAFSPWWPQLDRPRQDALVSALRSTLAARGGVLPVPSPALIACGVRAGSD